MIDYESFDTNLNNGELDDSHAEMDRIIDSYNPLILSRQQMQGNSGYAKQGRVQKRVTDKLQRKHQMQMLSKKFKTEKLFEEVNSTASKRNQNTSQSQLINSNSSSNNLFSNEDTTGSDAPTFPLKVA